MSSGDDAAWTVCPVHEGEDNGQASTTIPKALREALGIEDGARIEWTVLGRRALRIDLQ